ncbi:hypothetical protein C8E83_3081 [Frondihabitans australicus]|uniref:Uncharacterized protein n=2 Tax=Frondihabitans australicus TaxID=386892 RepID=A0A495IIW3_9MICO|nr:hypothetical protein C8E83_3081 [Frondihabitans australicus]
MFTPGGRLFLSAIIDGGVSIVVIGGTIAEAGVALLLRNRAPRESAGLRYAAAALGGIAGGAAIALLLALGVLLAVRPGMQEDLLMAFSIVGGGLLGCAYEAVFRIRERRARRRHATEALRSSLD